MAEKIEFWQVYFHEKHLSSLYPFAKPYYNEILTPFFENSVIKNLVLASESDKIGVVSWALKSKMRLNVRPLTAGVLQDDFDVLSFSRNSKFHKMLKAAEVWHPGFTKLLSKIMEKAVGVTPREPKYPVYQNAFIARTTHYKRYVRDFLAPCMEVMENDPEVSKECWKDSGYTKLKREPLSDKAKKDLKVSYYPMHPFLCERLFSQWLGTQNLNVKYL